MNNQYNSQQDERSSNARRVYSAGEVSTEATFHHEPATSFCPHSPADVYNRRLIRLRNRGWLFEMYMRGYEDRLRRFRQMVRRNEDED